MNERTAGHDNDTGQLEETVLIKVSLDGSSSNELQALCRLVFDAGSKKENDHSVGLTVLAVTEGDKLCAWVASFSGNMLRQKWKLDDSSSTTNQEGGDPKVGVLWKRLKQYLSLDVLDRVGSAGGDAGSVASSRTDARTMIHTIWKLRQDSTLVLEVKQGRAGALRNLWNPTFEPAPSQAAFRAVLLQGLLPQMQQYQTKNQKLINELERSSQRIDHWKQTCNTLEHGWQREKGPLIKNFLKLYNIKQTKIEDLERRVKELEHQLSVIGGSSIRGDDDAEYTTKQAKALQAGVPDDDEAAVDRIISLQFKNTVPQKKQQQQQVDRNLKRRRNQATGAIEYLDEHALFQDETLFPDVPESNKTSTKDRHGTATQPSSRRRDLKRQQEEEDTEDDEVDYPPKQREKNAHARAQKQEEKDESATEDGDDDVDYGERSEILATLAQLGKK